VLEGFGKQHIAFFRRTYLTNNEEDGLVILYADEELVEGLVEDQKTFVSYINRKFNKNKSLKFFLMNSYSLHPNIGNTKCLCP